MVIATIRGKGRTPMVSSENTGSEHAERIATAHRRMKAGEYADAAALALTVIDDLGPDYTPAPLLRDAFMIASFAYFRLGRIAEALPLIEKAVATYPEDAELAANQAVMLSRLGRHEEALAVLTRWTTPDRAPSANMLDAACAAAYRCGKSADAVAYGRRALETKHRNIEAAAPPTAPVPSLDTSHPERNIISFSLWGTDRKYRDGALQNAHFARIIYPGWTARFYINDSVEAAFAESLRREGAQVLTVQSKGSPHIGYYWRFLVADDPSVDRYVVRDVDSVVNVRERVAVDEWVQSGRHFHLMRDFHSHSELILAGLWGGVRGALPPLLPLVTGWLTSAQEAQWVTGDQQFLRRHVWPVMQHSVMAHDSVFGALGARDFPSVGQLPSGRHVGQAWLY